MLRAGRFGYFPCDLVMGVVYGGAAGAFGTLSAFLSAGLPALMGVLPAAVLADHGLQAKLKDLATHPPTPHFPLEFFAAGSPSPTNLNQIVGSLPLPLPPANICARQVATFFKLTLPRVPLPNDGCVIPPPLFARIPTLPFIPPLPGSTAGYPVQTQILVEAIVREPGYGRHKLAVQIFLLQQLGYDNADLKKAAALISQKSPRNAFFVYLTGASNEAADILLEKCPAPNGSLRSRHQWTWERDEKTEKELPWLYSSYWDCIFGAKLLVNKNEDAPRILVEMQHGQTDAVRTPFSHKCSGFRSEISAKAQSPNPGNNGDYQVVFTGPPNTTFPEKHWYFDRTFIAPCPGWYSTTISVNGLKAPSKSIKLVKTSRYGDPIELEQLPANPSQAVQFYLFQYDAIALVLSGSTEPRSIDGAQVSIKWDFEIKPAVDSWKLCTTQNQPPAEVIRHCSSVITSTKTEWAGLRDQAFWYRARARRETDLDGAIADLTSAIEINKSFVHAFNSRGVAYADKKSYDRALENLNHAIELDHNFSNAYANRGAVYFLMNAHDNAMNDFNRSLQLQENPYAYSGRGHVYFVRHEYSLAIMEYNKALSLAPSLSGALVGRGKSYHMIGRFDEALDDFDKATKHHPTLADPYIGRGDVYVYGKAQYDRAVSEYETAIKLDPTNREALHGRDVAHGKLGR